MSVGGYLDGCGMEGDDVEGVGLCVLFHVDKHVHSVLVHALRNLLITPPVSD